ncbi:hypothetical protein LCGC14_0756630 [marine sediment metagenome]|uniref:Uncharacterized protein n=1 Tax=marine sediment metagenome TaxID=412755 RepID=A0A0F9QM78_9ZZZZ
MENKVEETGMERFRRLQKEAKELGITGHYKADEFEKLIAQAKLDGKEVVVIEPIKESEKLIGGITAEEAKKIDARLKYEEEAREKFKVARQVQIDRASIVAESESLKIKVELPENPTELELAKARLALGMKKVEVKPSPETVRIEGGVHPLSGKTIPPSPRGYYVFTNLEQDDAAHTVNPGGKYLIHLIPDQIHVLSEWHIKFFEQKAVTPIYKRVPTGIVPSKDTVGQMAEECRRTGGKPRFSFSKVGDAPDDAPFGLVTDIEVLDELRVKEEQLI